LIEKTNEENSNCAEIATANTGESQTAANGGSGPYHQWECTRHVNQLFIRGDNVILIQKIQS
jgi:small nuclear ribonucleoprotein (snRNP)-like protein